MSLPLSIVIITYNEEKNLDLCLQSLPQGAELIIVDSYSSDATIKIAEKYQAKIFFKKFESYCDQKNYGLSKAQFDFVLSLDADERCDPILKQSIESQAFLNSSCLLYRVNRQLVFMHKKLRFGKAKDAPIRLFNKTHFQFENHIHETIKYGTEKPGVLPGTLSHYSYHDLSDYLSRFNHYTTKISQEHYRKGKKVRTINLVLRPFFEFWERYVLRLGFLDGYEGYVYALLSSGYAFMKYAKLKELYSKKERIIGAESNMASSLESVE